MNIFVTGNLFLAVDKALLETPEDEIDFQKVPLRDLILLAEYRERMAVYFSHWIFTPSLL